jgi:hypothetical protein
MSSKDPDRWADAGSDAPLTVQRLLQNAREDLPGPRTLAALGVVVPTLLAESTATAAATGAKLGAGAVAKAGGVAASTKLGAALLVSLAAGGAYYYVQTGGEPSAPRSNPPVEAQPNALKGAEIPPVSKTPPSDADEVVETPALEPSPSKPAPAGRGPEKSNADELPLLQQARAALRREPAKALTLVRRHEQEFPNSRYAQEREVIRIEALRGLGKDDEADRLGEDFNRRFPGSAHKSKLNRESQ